MTDPFSVRPDTPLRRGPLVVGISLASSALSTALAIAADPTPFATSAAILVVIGLLVVGLVAVAGLLISRGRWSGRFAWAVTAAVMGIAMIRPWDFWSVAITASSLVTVAGLSGPWMDGWLRKRPAALGPGSAAVVVLLLGAASPLIAGAAAWRGADWADIAYAVVMPAAAWGYGRQLDAGWWALRLLPIPLAVLAASGNGWPGAVAVVLAGIAITSMSWTKTVRLAIHPLMDTLPGPRVASPKEDA